MSRVNLDIIVEHKSDGKVLPRTILWPDGRKFEIDKVLDVRMAPALKAGGVGMRYLCKNRCNNIAMADDAIKEGDCFNVSIKF